MRTKLLVTSLIFLALATSAAPAHAGGVVGVCDEAHLRAALAGGGTVTFTCSGAIILAATLAIADDTTIDGSGQTIAISGNHEVRGFTVSSGVALALNELTVADGYADMGAGIVVEGTGTLAVTKTTLTHHSTSGSAWGHHGGAILLDRGTVIVADSIVSDNWASDGAGIYSESGTVTVTNSIFTGNHAFWSQGGGIASGAGVVTVSDSTFSGNIAQYGAGIENMYGTLIVRRSTFSGNGGWMGGGIYNGGTAVVAESTFAGNSSGSGVGGGICNESGSLTVSNSTFSGNSAFWGGGIGNLHGTVAVFNSTLSGNEAGSGGGIHNAVSTGRGSLGPTGVSSGAGNDELLLTGTITLKNSIVANSPRGDNCFGPITNGGANLSYPDATCPGVNADPKLGVLQDNGGPTQTMDLGAGSAALDTGSNVFCAAAPVNNLDQRGVTRPQAANCDKGAVEHLLSFRTWHPTVRAR